MARANINTFFKLLLVLTLALMIWTTESTKISRKISIGYGNRDSTPVCNAVHGTETGDSCSAVAQEFGLSLQDFLNINPNINCDAVFVGQWLCVDGSA